MPIKHTQKKPVRIEHRIVVSALRTAAVIIFAVLALAGEKTRKVGQNPTLTDKNASMESLQGNSARERIEVEALTVRARGFEPSAISRPRGLFLLAVDNRSQIPDLELQVIRLNGNQLAGKRMRGKELRWRQLLDLPPGNYVLTEANHREWRCQITITSR